MSESDRREFEISLEIDAPPERVWQALTDARELVRWFPLEAEVEPKPGGRYFISWQNEWQGEGRIEIYEPSRHLRTSQPVGQKREGGAVELAIDYHLEARGGRTVLRLVHSGFGKGAEWDEEYDSISVGWNFELRSLRHYLERHRGRDRRVVYLVSPKSGLTADELWQRVMLDGFGGAEPPAGLAEGERYSLSVGGGETFSGTVVDFQPPKQLAGTVADLGDALFRVEVFGSRVSLWLAVWDGAASSLAPIEQRWRDMLSRLFTPPAAREA